MLVEAEGLSVAHCVWEMRVWLCVLLFGLGWASVELVCACNCAVRVIVVPLCMFASCLHQHTPGPVFRSFLLRTVLRIVCGVGDEAARTKVLCTLWLILHTLHSGILQLAFYALHSAFGSRRARAW